MHVKLNRVLTPTHPTFCTFSLHFLNAQKQLIFHPPPSSPQIEIHIRSPSARTVKRRDQGHPRTMPIFGDRDHVEGTIYLDARLAATPGRLTISVSSMYECSQIPD